MSKKKAFLLYRFAMQLKQAYESNYYQNLIENIIDMAKVEEFDPAYLAKNFSLSSLYEAVKISSEAKRMQFCDALQKLFFGKIKKDLKQEKMVNALVDLYRVKADDEQTMDYIRKIVMALWDEKPTEYPDARLKTEKS